MSDLHNEGYEIVLVTSGAIGAGMGKLNLTERPRTIPEKQAVAAVGQVALIHMYQKIFSEYGKTVITSYSIHYTKLYDLVPI